MANLRDKDRDQLQADEVLEEEQLTLADDEDRLPWLEADDEEEEPAVNIGFVAGVALAGLLAILLLLGGIWWWNSSDRGGDVVADGSTIEAPAEPYKVRPEEPGGTAVTGTGDLSFAQGEGETRESQIASDPVPAPGFTEAPEAGPGGVGVQVGAYTSRAQAQEGWATLRQRHEALSGVNQRIVEAEVDGAKIYRLQAVAADVDAARTLCNAIKSGGGDCQVKN